MSDEPETSVPTRAKEEEQDENEVTEQETNGEVMPNHVVEQEQQEQEKDSSPMTVEEENASSPVIGAVDAADEDAVEDTTETSGPIDTAKEEEEETIDAATATTDDVVPNTVADDKTDNDGPRDESEKAATTAKEPESTDEPLNDKDEQDKEEASVVAAQTDDNTEEEEANTEKANTAKGAQIDKAESFSLPPMENYKSVSEPERKRIHARLKNYETRRKATYTHKLESSSLYWRAFRGLLDASIFETSRAERLVRGAAKANRDFGVAMQASYRDVFLDEKGQIVTDPKKQKKLQDMRALQDYVGAPPATDPKLQQRKKASLPEMAAQRKHEDNLAVVIDTQATVATQFQRNADLLETEICGEVGALRDNLQDKVANIRVVGDQILAELELVEKEVNEAWGE